VKPDFALELALAGLPPFRFESDDPRWSDALMPRYGPFACHQPGAALGGESKRLRLHATAMPPDHSELARFGAEPVAVEVLPGGWNLSTSWCRIAFDRRSGQCDVAGPLHRLAIDLALRHLLVEDLADGLVIHAALLVDDERAFLCAGPSGCGKSTLAELLPGAALCDELAVARRDAKGRWRAWSLPFWNGRPGSGRLAAIHLLEHGRRSARRGLDPAEALRRIAPEVIWPAHDEAATGRSLELLGALAGEVPISALAFRPEREVWDWIAAPAAA
jgi:hypothetical protein